MAHSPLPETPVAAASVAEAITDVRQGRLLVVVDDTDRAGGALVLAAEHVDPSAITFMALHARGLVTLCLTPERCAALGLRPMTYGDDGARPSSSMISIEAREGISTGISAYDRARTISVAVDPAAVPHDLVEPGHVFPLQVAPEGLLTRSGHAEAAVDLARLAGLRPAGVVCTILGESGAVAELAELDRFCGRHDLRMVDIGELAAHRRRRESFLERAGDERVDTTAGHLRAISFRDRTNGDVHVALCRGDARAAREVLVHVHPGCLGGDVLGSRSCGCRERLQLGLGRVAAAEAGVVVYLAGRGSCERPETDGHAGVGSWGDAGEAVAATAHILIELGADTVRMLDDDPRTAAALVDTGIRVTGREGLTAPDETA